MQTEFNDENEQIAEWWDDVALVNEAPALTAAADVALVLVIQGEQDLQLEDDIRSARRISVESYELPVRPLSTELVLLCALALVETIRRITSRDPLPLEVAARLDKLQSVVRIGEHLGQAAALLADDASARAVAGIRPPSPPVMRPPSTMYACHAVATRPAEDWGTLPQEVVMEFDRLLADPSGGEWAELRSRAHAALDACARDRDLREAGTLMHTLRALRIRRCWLDQHPDREVLVQPGEPGAY
ncbi:hypothetical protein [Saccharopolyspora pogona]|uniref:hypothetical protein n=1 Tax=Saccharopolyspora pogona TaxID=333966 RepID=UPI00168A0D5B|nr:hypothetical protein [Saccharopolyspora pogona]